MTIALADGPHPMRPIIVRPAPRREPPFDDELPSRHLHAVGPFDRPLPFARAPRVISAIAARSRARADLPDPALWSRRLLVGIIEAAAGKRPLQQLAALLNPPVARGLVADFERAAKSRRPHWIHAATVRSVRASEPADGVAEVCATVRVGPRVRAVAMRLEASEGRWRCTRLHFG
ncbi:MAG: uncharacterized protein JWO57_4259 [Pseudonocardiales bacterium]|nr:uncharacterized protein [Pseudonocardiales bacterium]